MILKQLTAASLAILVMLGLSNLWSSFAPVVVFMQAKDWRFAEDHVSATITGYKLNNCEFIGESVVGWQMIDNEWHETSFVFMADTSPNSTRPASYQRQNFGRWRWDRDITATQLRVSMQHLCGGTLRTTIIGPFSYGLS